VCSPAQRMCADAPSSPPPPPLLLLLAAAAAVASWLARVESAASGDSAVRQLSWGLSRTKFVKTHHAGCSK
jgi:hypothetical protein